MGSTICFIILSVISPNDLIQNVNFISTTRVSGSGSIVCNDKECFKVINTLQDVVNKIQQCSNKKKIVPTTDNMRT